MPFGIVGGRIYHVITDNQIYFGPDGKGFCAAFRIWDGGLGHLGRGRPRRRRRLDRRTPRRASRCRRSPTRSRRASSLAQAIGRFGNWFNQELFGAPDRPAVGPARSTRPTGPPATSSTRPSTRRSSTRRSGACSSRSCVIWADRRLTDGPRSRLRALRRCSTPSAAASSRALRIDEAHRLLRPPAQRVHRRWSSRRRAGLHRRQRAAAARPRGPGDRSATPHARRDRGRRPDPSRRARRRADAGADDGRRGGSHRCVAPATAIASTRERRDPPDDHHRDVTGGWLRPAVFGAMDGLVSNFALMAGVAGGAAALARRRAASCSPVWPASPPVPSRWRRGSTPRSPRSPSSPSRSSRTSGSSCARNAEGEAKELAQIWVRRGVDLDARRARSPSSSAATPRRRSRCTRARRSAWPPASCPTRGWRPARRSSPSPLGALDPAAARTCSVPRRCSGRPILSVIGLFGAGALVSRVTARSWWFSGLRQLVVGVLAAAGHLRRSAAWSARRWPDPGLPGRRARGRGVRRDTPCDPAVPPLHGSRRRPLRSEPAVANVVPLLDPPRSCCARPGESTTRE